MSKRMKAVAMLGLSIMALTGAGTASAAKVVTTYRGLVTSGTDGSNLFGGGNLQGKAYVATFEYNFAVAAGAPAALSGFGKILALITINGKTAGVESDMPATIADAVAGRGDVVEYRPNTAFYFAVASMANNFVTATSATDGIDYRTAAGDERSGSFFRRYSSCGFGGCWETSRTDLRFDIERVTVAAEAVAAVPEPSSWAMMLAGFSGMAAALRLRRRRPVAA